MAKFITVTNTGQISSINECPDNLLKYHKDYPNIIIVDYETPISLDKHYFLDNKIVPMSPKPSIYHEFDYVTKEWIDPRTNETEWIIVREKRNILLQESDWTDTLSAKTRLGEQTFSAWQEYRQALRDITNQSDPFNIVWPVQP